MGTASHAQDDFSTHRHKKFGVLRSIRVNNDCWFPFIDVFSIFKDMIKHKDQERFLIDHFIMRRYDATVSIKIHPEELMMNFLGLCRFAFEFSALENPSMKTMHCDLSPIDLIGWVANDIKDK